jgi:hypothetical protein
MTTKPKSAASTTSVQDWLVHALWAAAAAWLASYIDNSLMTNYATALFWETWLSAGSPLAAWVPLVVFALFTGVVLGLIIGWVFPQRVAMKVAGIAALLQLIVALLSGSIASGIVIAVGLLAGALPPRPR